MMEPLAGLFPAPPIAWTQAAASPWALALVPVAIGLGSSVTHCAGMCGPIHFFLASRAGLGHAVWRYHAGRVVGYAALGGLAGLVGSSLAGGLTAGTSGEVIKTVAAYGLILAYALFGLQLLGWMPRALRLETLAARLFPSRLFGRWTAEGPARAMLFPAGLAASLLPCPSTHAMLLFGIGLANPWAAAGAMALLAVSTLPVFAAIPRRLPSRIPLARHYGTVLGLLFLGLSAWRLYGAAFSEAPACH